ncbi:ribosome assembly protein METTL17, mitochondrial [Haematobia irritans]|uniref:ribosome assembly protein METTL17, mitochondrial n=1 Tax=Haematobia irritans TaxID=7368 RepID=UPI003F500F3E
MNLSGKNIVTTLNILTAKQAIRKICKIAVQLDESILGEDTNPRRHPGITQFKRYELPAVVQKSLVREVGDYPVKKLMDDCKKLNQFIASRHPPVEDFEVNKTIQTIKEELDKIMSPEQHAKLDEYGMKKLERRKEQLIIRRMKERTFAWKPVKYGPYEAIVYALGRGPLEYSVLMRIIREIKYRDSDFQPQSFLDFGSGVGTGMWAASGLWKDSIYEYYNIDSSREMNDLSELILKGGNENQHSTLRNVFYRQFLPNLETKYDLILVSYSLFELPSARNRQEVILNLWKKCDGYLVVVEEGSRRGSQLVNEARDLILSLEDHRLVGHVFAPCPHDHICPRLSNIADRTPCNFQVIYTPITLGTTINKDVAARFSYVVLKKGLPKDTTRRWPRLVRPTLVRSKHSICRMCTPHGNLREIIFTQSKHGRFTYRCARASRWGDRLPVVIETKSN